MNEVTDMQLDRLVDGELAGEEYRAVVAALDAQPQEWRRCALAFLEAQALRREIGSVLAVREPSKPVIAKGKDPHPSPLPRGEGAGVAKVLLAMAASFLLALPVGAYLFPRKAESIIVTAPPKPPETPRVNMVNKPNNDNIAAAPRPLGTLRLETEDGQIDVPYYSARDGAPVLNDENSARAASLVESLRQRGHHVERSPSVMPVDLANGSRVYLPVDHYRITPVVNRAVQ